MPTTLIELIEQTSRRYPENIAYRFADKEINYIELTFRAKSLAKYLNTIGVERGDRVAILLYKGLDMVIALYGILYAGAAYVPIDTTAPSLRISNIVRKCGISLIIGNSKLLETLNLKGVTFLSPDAEAEWSDAQGQTNTAVSRIVPDDLAYIIFTSGSTGTPKGIVHTHASAFAFASMAAKHFDLQPEDRLAGISPLQFDMSTFDLFAANYAGACTILISEAHIKMPASLTQLVQNESITIWYSTPLSLIQGLEYGAMESRNLTSIRKIIYGGEPFPIRQLNKVMRALPNARFSNIYGPAEVNGCHVFDLPKGELLESDVPIGYTCKDVVAKVVDRDGKMASRGELWISAPTMQKGYWDESELTKSVTVTDDENKRRYYKTGDFVDVSDHGLFRFIGRSDRQIKLRGYRIELDEVESALLSISGIKQVFAAVDTWDSNPELSAHILLEPSSSLAKHEIRLAVSKLLPGYAVPQKLYLHHRFPLTSSGKIDRQALKAMNQG